MTRHIIFGIIFVSMGFWLCGCATNNGFIEFYDKDTSMTPADVKKLKKSRNFPNKIRLIPVKSVEEGTEVGINLVKNYGCFFIGMSSFEGVLKREDSAKKAAEHFGANTVVTLQEYIGTRSGSVTLPGTSYTTANVYAGGNYGSGNATTYSTPPQTIPYSVSIYHREAVFLLCP